MLLLLYTLLHIVSAVLAYGVFFHSMHMTTKELRIPYVTSVGFWNQFSDKAPVVALALFGGPAILIIWIACTIYDGYPLGIRFKNN